jgi:hypothetical protein
MASFQIVRDIGKKRNIKVHQQLTDWIVPGREKDFFKQLNKKWTFLKHAKEDPHGTMEPLDYIVNDLNLLFCCQYYKELTNDLSLEMRAFSGFAAVVYPKWVKKELRSELSKIRKDVTFPSRRDQLKFGKELLTSIRSTPTGSKI